ncbi:MAG: lysophospholipid acyltransferase family protein [Methylobacterium mesophilicum]|nr:lysophospholipid acyltransferase family protein [Methylobacterium mesophilicum]
MRFAELSYASPQQPFLKRAVIRTVEQLSGRNHYAESYDWWRRNVVPTGEQVFGRMLSLAGVGLSIEGEMPDSEPRRPLVIVANHPFGLGDGIALLSIAERLGRPFRVLLHADLLRVPELRPYALAVDFEETKDAQKRNLEMRREALSLLNAGTIIAIFPAGGVATAPKVFGRAEDLPWKLFVAKLIQEAQADVLPVFFEGQNGFSFHAVSRFSLTLRLSLIIREFRRLAGKTITARLGAPIRWSELAEIRDRKAIITHLRDRVFALEASRPAPIRRLPRPTIPRWPEHRLPRRRPA